MPDELQSSAPEGTEDSEPSNDAADVTTSSSAPDVRKELEARLTEMGRERKAQQQRVQYLESQIGYAGQAIQNQNQQLNYIQSQMSKRQWDDFENRLANMSPVDAANERARVAMEYSRNLEQRLAAAQQAPPVQQQPQRRQETDEEYSLRIANEKLARANARHRLTGKDALTIQDMPASAWEDPDTFGEEAGIMAKQRAAAREDGAKASPDKIQEMVAKEVAKITGANRGMSPSVSPGDPEPGSQEVAKIAARNVTNRRGPGAGIAELRKHREQIAAKLQ